MRWIISWGLYGLGHGVSVVMNAADFLGHLYPVYNRLMGASIYVQGDGAGPWLKPEEAE